MGQRLPKANVWFAKQTKTSLPEYAQNIVTKLALVAVKFPDVPIALVDIQDMIDVYNILLASATGPGAGIINTNRLKAQKVVLQNALRVTAQYVNTVVADDVAAGVSYDAIEATISSTGFQLSKQPVPAGPLPGPIVKYYTSPAKGQYYSLLYKVPNAKGYVVRVINTTDGTTQATFELTFPNTRINIVNDLISGNKYTFQYASIGANTTRDFSSQVADIFIL